MLVYAVGDEHPLREPSRRLVDAIGEGAIDARTTAEVVQEFAHVHSRRRDRPRAVQHATRYARLLGPLLGTGEQELREGLRIYERYERLGAFDAVLAGVALANDARALVSADRDFAAVRRLPFVELGSRAFDRLFA